MKMATYPHRFSIGTQYLTRGKHPKLCTVTDTLVTINSKGQIVRTSYISTHEFMGQTVTEHDVCDATIAIGKARMEEKAA
jgi:hypothetical protein